MNKESWRSQNSVSVTFIQVLVISDIFFALENCDPRRTSLVLHLVWMMQVEIPWAAATSTYRGEMGLSVKSSLMVVLVIRRYVAKCATVALERKVMTLILEMGCQRAGVLEKERNNVRKVLIKR